MASNEKADDITIPGEPRPTESGLIRTLTLVASVLTVASIAVNVILQVAQFLRKRPVQPDQRDRVQAAGLTLSIAKQLPGLIKQVRLFVSEVRKLA
jgi:hypothetical protein